MGKGIWVLDLWFLRFRGLRGLGLRAEVYRVQGLGLGMEFWGLRHGG